MKRLNSNLVVDEELKVLKTDKIAVLNTVLRHLVPEVRSNLAELCLMVPDTDAEFIELATRDKRVLNTFQSVHNSERVLELLTLYLEYLPNFIRYKEQLDEGTRNSELVGKNLIEPIWNTISSGPFGSELVCAFYTRKCPHDCVFCSLHSINDDSITPNDQLAAFGKAIDLIYIDPESTPNTVAILNQGSWYNEVEEKSRDLITKRTNQLNCCKWLRVESRPEHITTERVLNDLNNLRPDQKLQICIGVETTDNLVASLAGKGFGWDEFVEAAKKIVSLHEEMKNRVSIAAYNIMKLPFATEREALEGSVRMDRMASELASKLGISIQVHHQPTVISEGTMQHYLHGIPDVNGEPLYQNMDYFTVAEVIARAYCEMPDEVKNIYIGGRDDFDKIATIPMVKGKDRVFSPLDSDVYGACQNFNGDGDKNRFILNIGPALINANGEWTDEFIAWEKEVYGDKTSSLRELANLYVNMKDALTIVDKEHIELNAKIRQLSEQMEDNPELQIAAKIGKDKLVASISHQCQQFIDANDSVTSFRVNNVIKVQGLKKEGLTVSCPPGFYVEYIILVNGRPRSEWIFFPVDLRQ